MALKIRKDDQVKVISGKDRGKTGRVLRVDPAKQKVFVEGMNVQKRHTTPRTLRDTQRAQELGGIVETEGPIHVSNVMLLDPKSGDPTRVRIKRDGGRRVRVAKQVRHGDRLMEAAAQAQVPPRLKERYEQEIRSKLQERFGYSSVMQVPRVEKITLNMGVGEAKQDDKLLEAASEQLGDHRRPAAERAPRAQVDRQLQAARGHARGRVR